MAIKFLWGSAVIQVNGQTLVVIVIRRGRLKVLLVNSLEEAGIKVDPKDLEHVATKTVTNLTGKITIHGFKLDQGKHKTTVAGDPDEEVYRWIWKSLPLPKDVAENLHMFKKQCPF